jgi:hypothetical protein
MTRTQLLDTSVGPARMRWRVRTGRVEPPGVAQPVPPPHSRSTIRRTVWMAHRRCARNPDTTFAAPDTGTVYRVDEGSAVLFAPDRSGNQAEECARREALSEIGIRPAPIPPRSHSSMCGKRRRSASGASPARCRAQRMSSGLMSTRSWLRHTPLAARGLCLISDPEGRVEQRLTQTDSAGLHRIELRFHSRNQVSVFCKK